MDFRSCFILLVVVFADNSKCDDACSNILKCLRPLNQYDIISKLVPGGHLSADICQVKEQAFDCADRNLARCRDNEVIVEKTVIQHGVDYMCRSPRIIEGLKNSFCSDGPLGAQYIKKVRKCLSDMKEPIDYYLSTRDYCRVSETIQFCVGTYAGGCGKDYSDLTDIMFLYKVDVPQSRRGDCYEDYLVADFIQRRITA